MVKKSFGSIFLKSYNLKKFTNRYENLLKKIFDMALKVGSFTNDVIYECFSKWDHFYAILLHKLYWKTSAIKIVNITISIFANMDLGQRAK